MVRTLQPKSNVSLAFTVQQVPSLPINTLVLLARTYLLMEQQVLENVFLELKDTIVNLKANQTIAKRRKSCKGTLLWKVLIHCQISKNVPCTITVRREQATPSLVTMGR